MIVSPLDADLIVGTFAWADDICLSHPHQKRGLSRFATDSITDLLRSKSEIGHTVLLMRDAHGYEAFYVPIEEMGVFLCRQQSNSNRD